MFEDAAIAVFVCDPHGEIRACNALGQRLLGQVTSGGKNIRDLLPPADRATCDDHLAALRRSREPVEFRSSLVGPGGEPAEFAVWLTPVLDAHGEMTSATVWFHDITARVQLRRSMRKRERLAALGALCGALAHHYNNLLCCIATSLEYAMNMNTMSAMRRALRRASDAVSRATDLTQQLLAFAQADHRASDMADLTEVVLYHFDQNETRLHERNIRVHLAQDPQVPIVPVPREHFLIILNNLTANAIEAMPAGGDLYVAIRRAGNDAISLSVTDTGGGIPPEHMEHLFEPFFTTKGELGEGGSRQAGMGLAVAHGLVSEMHGSISACNVPGGGARIEIRLPLPAGPTATPPDAPAASRG